MKRSLAALVNLAGVCSVLLPTGAQAAPQIPWNLPPGLEFTAKRSSEAVLSFEHRVEFKSASTPTPALAREKINAQLLHLFGPMSAAPALAVPKGDEKVTRISVAPKSGQPGTFSASYHYQGTIDLEAGPEETYEVLLPVNPDTIYKEGILLRRNTETYPCTDAHYDGEGDFWYFWNPSNPGCPLREGVHFDKVKGRIRRLPSATSTYPEYERLAGPDGVIRISLLFGMDDPTNLKLPLASTDINAENFRETRTSLLRMGYHETVWTKDRIRALLPPRTSPHPYVADYELQTPKGRIVITLFFGPSGIDERSRAFHYFFKDAVENSSVLIYDGHSGLGGHLDLKSIEETEGFKLKPHPDRYQILFFNSCTSYTYYNSMFFDRKRSAADPRGTKNLDVLTNGLATQFDVMHETNMALIKAIQGWATGRPRVSYQALAAAIDSDNLFAVNGDEDNPTR